MIPERAEFYIVKHETPVDDSNGTLLTQRKLGVCYFTDKRASQTRELKSIFVDTACNFVRISLHKNFVNRLNRFSQVSLIALNLHGSYLGDAAPVGLILAGASLTAPRNATAMPVIDD